MLFFFYIFFLYKLSLRESIKGRRGKPEEKKKHGVREKRWRRVTAEGSGTNSAGLREPGSNWTGVQSQREERQTATVESWDASPGQNSMAGFRERPLIHEGQQSLGYVGLSLDKPVTLTKKKHQTNKQTNKPFHQGHQSSCVVSR